MTAAQEQRKAQGARMRRGLVEAEILERGAELFAARGFAATSMQDIADALGSSRPALYHYFRSKDEILDRLIQGLAVVAACEMTHRVIAAVEDQVLVTVD